MAKLTKLPGTQVISGFKGTIDFYVWKGIACARAWPRSPGHRRAPAVEAAWPPFAWAATNWKNLDLETKQAYNQMAVSTNMTGRDIFMKTFINKATLGLSLTEP